MRMPLSEIGVALVLVVIASVCSFVLLCRRLPAKWHSSAVRISNGRRPGQQSKGHGRHPTEVAVSARRSARSSTKAKSSHAQPSVPPSPPLAVPADVPSTVASDSCTQHCPVASALLSVDATYAPLSKAFLLRLDATARERELGERLYTCVRLIEPCRAGKVTGMLLELEDDELLEILGTRGDAHVRAATLRRWVHEANEVLAEAEGEEAGAAPLPTTTPSVPQPILTAIEDWQLVERKGGSRTRRRTHSAHSPDSVVAASITGRMMS